MRTKLKDVFLDPISAGIFDTFQNLDVPWKDEGIDESLDLFFITNYGERLISPLTNTCLDTAGKLTAAKQTLLATALVNLFGKNWTKEYAVLSAQYDPIENHSMEEKHTGNDTRLETPTNWKETTTEKPGADGYSETETQTPTNWIESRKETVGNDGYTETETQTPTNWEKTIESDKSDNDVEGSTSLYAFNSSDPVPISKSETQTDSKIVETQSGTYETKREISGEKDVDIERTGTYETKREIEGEKITETGHTGTYEDKTTYNSTLTRSGNIGVTTSQQMIEQEINLWKWNYFRDVVFPDVANALTISLY